jgi:hypothetical protein
VGWAKYSIFKEGEEMKSEEFEGSKLIDTIALMQQAFSFATFAFIAANTSESSRVV